MKSLEVFGPESEKGLSPESMEQVQDTLPTPEVPELSFETLEKFDDANQRFVTESARFVLDKMKRVGGFSLDVGLSALKNFGPLVGTIGGGIYAYQGLINEHPSWQKFLLGAAACAVSNVVAYGAGIFHFDESGNKKQFYEDFSDTVKKSFDEQFGKVTNEIMV